MADGEGLSGHTSPLRGEAAYVAGEAGANFRRATTLSKELSQMSAKVPLGHSITTLLAHADRVIE
jgi:hypothetical protein